MEGMGIFSVMVIHTVAGGVLCLLFALWMRERKRRIKAEKTLNLKDEKVISDFTKRGSFTRNKDIKED